MGVETGTELVIDLLRIDRSYETRGMLTSIVSHYNDTVGSGSVLNEVELEYNDLGLLEREYQEHEGAKDGNTLYTGYNYDTSAASGQFTKGLRPKSVRYPNGRLIHYTYGTANQMDDILNRLGAIQDDNGGSPNNVLASYKWLGLATSGSTASGSFESGISTNVLNMALSKRCSCIVPPREFQSTLLEDSNRLGFVRGSTCTFLFSDNLFVLHNMPKRKTQERYASQPVQRIQGL